MGDNYIGDKIREIRKKNGLSQEEFAYRVGVAKQTVSSWELGTNKPNFAKIKVICEIFNASADDFLEHDNKVCATMLESQSMENDKAKDEIAEEHIPQEEKKPQKPKVLSIIMLVLGSVFLAFAAFIMATTLFTTNIGLVTVQSASWNVPELVNICLFILLVAVLVGVIVALIRLLRKNHKK